MPPEPTSAIFRDGFRATLPFALVVGPFGLLFGVLATEAGLDLFATMTMSILIVAGAAQFTALQMMVDQAPTIIVILASLAVNLRLAMYSAALAPHLGPAPLWVRAFAAYLLTDQGFAISLSRYEQTSMTLRQKAAFFFGTAAAVMPIWYVGTLVGALVGSRIPPEYALDFAVPITFLAIIAPMVRTLAHLAAAAVSVVGALVFAGVPFNGGILVAAILAMMAGAEVERQLARARAR